jgi:4-amino-4-deoxy-L-arabinose transferase-like glycosyltransferase
MKYLHFFFIRPDISTFCLALGVRIIYNLVVARGYYPLHDSLTYQSIAFNLLREHCYCLQPHQPTVDRAPLWPGIIATLYGLFGPHDRTVRLFLSLIGSGTCLLITLFASRLFNKRIGLFAGLLAAFYPFLYIYDGWLYTESIYTFLLLLFCYLLYQYQQSLHTVLLWLCGITTGLLALTRPNGIALLALFLLWISIIGKVRALPWRIIKRTVLIVPLTALIFIAPWTLRNYFITRAFVPVAVGDGKVLLGAYNDMILQRPYYLGIWILPNESTPAIAQQFPSDCAGECEVRRDMVYRTSAKQWITNHIPQMPYLLVLHSINMWQTTSQEADLAINRFPDRPASQAVVLMMKLLAPVVLVLAASGAIVTWRRWRDLLFIYLLLILTIVQSIVFYGIPRFRSPIEPFLILLGSGTLWWIGRQREKHQRRKSEAHLVAEEAILSRKK